MVQQVINVGAAPNDGTGDPARDAFTKANDNFTELYAAIDAALTEAEADAAYQPLNSALTSVAAGLTSAGLALLDDADAAAQRVTIGLGSVNNTSDASKPVSTATQAALDAKQPLATVLTNTTASFTTADETKLDSVAAGATAGATWGSNITGQPALISQSEAEAGTATNERIWTAQRVAQAIAALAQGGGGSGLTHPQVLVRGLGA